MSKTLSNINGVIISDCADDNAAGRQKARFASLFGSTPSFLRLTSAAHDLEAAGNLVDILDSVSHIPKSISTIPTVVLVNVAPRGNVIKAKWDNGTPFCYFKLDNILVVSTYDGLALSLVKRLGIAKEVHLMDIPTVVDDLSAKAILTQDEAEKIKHTQFRSLEFLPLVAYWISCGVDIISTIEPINELPADENKVWFVDSFGNNKTTLLRKDIKLVDGKVKLANGLLLPFYKRLTDVPDARLALTEGSSGFGDKRFLEIVKQRGNAAVELGLSVGSEL